ncbi:oxidoreductase [Saccharothrix obliqua]|uniref:oxidoreductase n=1 Tax=Saccharothrix obliqua TaxID=2861747 RepID=UPI001C5EDCEC|nr:oxidoreductase [Saccharothrix obliqua]MBW4720624.1 SDR family NAD(P)-dependent oxidoreductase [Saccharothrix obliqua]
MTNRVWLITGTSSGFGRAIAERALAAGDTVVATARHTDALAELSAMAPDRVTPMRLDVTDTNAIANVVQDAITWHGRIDVLVNNAGHAYVGAVEETPDAELRYMLEVHLHGPISLTKAVLPHMRARRSGAVVQISSMAGQVSWAGMSAYCTAKFALEGHSEALAAEVAPLGIKVLIVEPGAFRTDVARDLRQAPEIPDYAATTAEARASARTIHGTQPGDPAKAAEAILAALEADRTPLRLPLGADAHEAITAKLRDTLAEAESWRATAAATDL